MPPEYPTLLGSMLSMIIYNRPVLQKHQPESEKHSNLLGTQKCTLKPSSQLQLVTISMLSLDNLSLICFMLTLMVFLAYFNIRVCNSPLFVTDYFSQCLIWSPIISGYPKHIFSEISFLDPHQDPPKCKKVDFQVTPITRLMVL